MDSKTIITYRRAIAISLTVVVLFSLAFNIYNKRQEVRQLLEIHARQTWEHAASIHALGSKLGGFYVPADSYYPHSSLRQLTTTDGRTLDIVPPGFIMKELMGSAGLGESVKITAIKKPENPLEKALFQRFLQGQPDHVEIRKTEDKSQQFEFYRPYPTNDSCLASCHSGSTMTRGTIDSVLSIHLNMAPYLRYTEEKIASDSVLHVVFLFFALWFNSFGMGILLEQRSELQGKEKRIKLSTQLLGATLDATADGILAVSNDNSVLAYNHRLLQIIPGAEEHLQNDAIDTFRHHIAQLTEQPTKFEERVAEIYDHGSSDEIDLLSLTDGTTLERHAHPLMVDDQVIGRVWSFRDISARLKAERTLVAANRNLNNLIDTSPLPIVSVDTDHHVITWNKAAEELFGWSSDEVLGKPNPSLTDGDITSISHFLSLDAPQPIIDIYVRRRTKSGQVIDLSLSASPLHDQQGHLVGSVNFYTDISKQMAILREQRRARESAESANQAKSDFLANMSHEIRTPMNGVIGMLDLVLDGGLDDDQRESISLARESAESLLAILNEILDYAKIEAGELVIQPKPFPVLATLQEGLKIQSRLAERKGVEFRYNLHPALPKEITGDASRILQVVRNLADNAVKFTDFGSVTIRLRPTPISDGRNHLLLQVIDTGIGIDEQMLSRLFERFVQADSSRTRRYGGMGIGLTVTKQLVDLMEGTIWVESQPGLGSTFNVVLPVLGLNTDHGEDEYSPSAEDAIVCSLEGTRILAVDDNSINLRALSKILENYGAVVRTAANGLEALERYYTHPFDLIILDLQMPQMDGMETARRIREHEIASGLRTPIVALSAHAFQEDRDQALAAGMDDYLCKPVQREDLLSCCCRMLKRGV